MIADAITVSGDGKVNVLGQFDNVNALNLPAIHSSLALWIHAAVEPKDYGTSVDTAVRLLDPDGNLLLEIDQSLPIERPKPDFWRSGINIIIPFGSIIFPTPGDHAFTFDVSGQELGRAPCRVVQVQPTI